jgi:hypothetical protein
VVEWATGRTGTTDTWCEVGILSVTEVGDSAMTGEAEHGATLAHSVAGQCGQSEWEGRVQDADP